MGETIYQVVTWFIPLLLLASPALPGYQQATGLLARNDVRGAEIAVAEALAKDPRYTPAIGLAARLNMIGGRLSEARELLEKALASEPEEKSLRFLLGLCLYLQNDFAPALSAFTRADQSDADVLLYTALTQEGLNNVEAARAFYERALVANPRSAEIRVAYARLLRKQEETARAEALIDKALQLTPENRGALYEKGQCLLLRGEPRIAAEFGERALRAAGESPTEREVRYLLVRAYLKAGESGKAAEQRGAFEKLPLPLVR